MTEVKAGISNHSSPTDSLETVSLPESEERFRLVLEASPDGFIILGSVRNAAGAIADEWRYTYVNQEAARMLGRSPQELLNQPWQNLFPEADQQNSVIIQQFERAMAEQMTVRFEVFSLVINRWLDISLFPLPDGLAMCFRDISARKQAEEELRQREAELRLLITERKQAEEILRQSEERYRKIHDQVIVGISQADLTGRFIEVNERFCEIVGRSQAELLTLRMQDITHPDDLSNNLVLFQGTVTQGTSFEIEKRYIRPDGSIIWVRNYVSSIKDAAGQPQHTVAVTEDITERKQAEIALAQSNQTLQAIIQACPLAIMGLRSDGTVKIWNPAAERIFGWSQKEVLGKFLPAIPKNKQNEFLNNIAATMQGQVLAGVETQRHKKGNLAIDVALWSAPVDEAQTGISCLSIVADITERKQAEAAWRQNEAFNQQILESSEDCIKVLDLEGSLLYMSPGGQTLLRIKDITRFISCSWVKFWQEDDQSAVQEAVNKARAGGVGTFQAYCPTLTGEPKWWDVKVTPIRGADGQIERLLSISRDITARKQAQEALLESQALYQTLAEALPNLVWTLNSEGKLDFANQQWREALGVTIEQVNQVGWSLIVHPDDLPGILKDWEKVLSGETATEREYRHYMADGSYRWFIARMVVIRDQQGRLLRLVGTSTDIDERKRTEDALRSSEERLALASQAAKVGTFEWNIQTNKVYWTAEEEALYGLPGGGFAGEFENWLQAVHPDDRDRAEQDVQNAVNNSADLNTEFRVIHPTGEVHWLAAKGRIFYDCQNRPLRMIGMNEDITARKQLEMEREQLLQQLETTLGQFEAVINSMSEGLLVSDIQGNVLLFNPAALVLHEYKSLEQVRRHLHEFPDTFEGHDLQGNFIPLEEWPLAKVLRGQTYSNYEINVHRLDTNNRWIGSFSGTPVYDKHGKMTLAIVTMHDITERKQAELERLQLLEQERQAREQAEAANRIKDEFLAVLSHELRSPLNPILGWAKLLQTRQFDQKATKRALEIIERNAKLQTQLINDLLDVSRILRGKMMLDVCAIQLETIVDAALETVRLSAEAKDIEIHKVVVGDIGLVCGDSARLQQIIWNLLSNAVKFTPQKGQIEIRLEQVGTDIQIQVKDTGKGITPEFLPYVFEYFRQEDSTTTRKFGGLGLGLAIVRYLTELHGGTVKVESPGEKLGATFTVSLPLLKHENEQEIDEAVSAIAVVDASPLAQLRILVVDDEADMRELIFTILEQAGAEIKVAASAVEALEVLALFKPDILVSDIGMPEMDGYALMRKVRSLPPPESGKIPAIALTAYAGEIDQQMALAAGFHRHIAKPVDPEELVQAIVALGICKK